MRVYSDVFQQMMFSGQNFAGYCQTVLLTRMPPTIPSNAPQGIAGLLGTIGYQELTDSHYTSPTNRPVVQTPLSGGPTGSPSSVRLDGSAGTWIDGPDIAALAGAATVTIEVDCSLDELDTTDEQRTRVAVRSHGSRVGVLLPRRWDGT